MSNRDQYEVTSLAEGLPREIERVRGLLIIYEGLGPGCGPVCAMIKSDLEMAEQANKDQDTIAMLISYQKLVEYED